MNILIIGNQSSLGKATGLHLSKKHFVSYAGRNNADYYFDLTSNNYESFTDFQCDILINCASDFGGTQEEDYLRAERVNAVGILNVCGLAQRLRVKQLIVISSISAGYDPLNPGFGIYSLSKRHSEELAQLYCDQYHLPLTILRPSQIYDEQSTCRKHQGLFYFILDQAAQGNDFIIHGTNNPLRNYIYINDLTKIIDKVIEQSITGLYDCGNQQSIRLRELAEIAYTVFNTQGAVQFDESKPSIPDLQYTYDHKLYKKLCYEPNTSLYEGIHRIKSYRDTK